MGNIFNARTTALNRLIRFTIAAPLLTLLVTGCGTFPDRGDGAPRHNINLHAIPDATPRVEARSRYGNPTSYVEFGKRYHVRANSTPFQQHGIASWYGTKFHGRRTSSGEAYDMYAMTAAHKTLPLPTWVEVINHDNQQRIIVKVNDRGPFISGRIIDLSYAAAAKLGVIATGTANVTVRAIDPVQYQAQRRAKSWPSHTTRVGSNKATPQAATTIAMQPIPAHQAAVPITIQTAITRVKIPATANDAKAGVTTHQPRSIGTFYLQVAAFSERSNAEQLSQRLQSLSAGKIQIQPSQNSSQAIYRVRIGPLASLSEAGRIAAQITSMGLGEPRIMLD